MARVDNQSIPSELYALYIQSMGRASSSGAVKKRYPFRLPHMRSGAPRVSAAQEQQRQRFRDACASFGRLSARARERYFESAPEWNSVLWYYNYAMMSALNGNANAAQGGAGVIRTIQNIRGEVAASGITSLAIATVDPAKVVVMLYGASFISDRIQRGAGTVAAGSSTSISINAVNPALCTVNVEGSSIRLSVPAEGDGEGYGVQAYATALSAGALVVAAPAGFPGQSVPFSWEVIEHKSQTVYPVVDSVTANAVHITWALTPSQGAQVSATVIEYI